MLLNRAAALWFLVSAGLLAQPRPANQTLRDWNRHPAILQRPAPDTIYAIGDVHGDYERLVQLLQSARIMLSTPARPEEAAWSAGTATLVLTGDMIDKGPRSVDVLHLLIALTAAAHRAGGEVIALCGNHEAEFLADPDDPKSAEFGADLRVHGYSPSEVASCRGDLGAFLCGLPFAARIGDWFFSHAGNTSGRTLDQLSSAIEADFGIHHFSAPQLVGPASMLEARLRGDQTWFHGTTASRERELLDSYAQAVGARHMVQGHQHNNVEFADGVERHAGEMFQRWGLLFLIDVGMSSDINASAGAALRVLNNSAVSICPDRRETLIWDAVNKSDAGRAAPCEVLGSREASTERIARD